jgi:hypothetical protein
MGEREREGKGEVKSRQRGHFHHHIFRDQIAASYLRKIAHLELLSPQSRILHPRHGGGDIIVYIIVLI